MQIRLGMRYLRDVLKLRFPELRARAAAAAAAISEREVPPHEYKICLGKTALACSVDVAHSTQTTRSEEHACRQSQGNVQARPCCHLWHTHPF